jgi:hypothetical protein
MTNLSHVENFQCYPQLHALIFSIKKIILLFLIRDLGNPRICILDAGNSFMQVCTIWDSLGYTLDLCTYWLKKQINTLPLTELLSHYAVGQFHCYNRGKSTCLSWMFCFCVLIIPCLFIRLGCVNSLQYTVKHGTQENVHGTHQIFMGLKLLKILESGTRLEKFLPRSLLMTS